MLRNLDALQELPVGKDNFSTITVHLPPTQNRAKTARAK